MNTDFDFLSNLREQNPEAFEEYRQEVLDEYFNSLPEERQVKARQQQWLLDNDLRKFKDPIAKYNRTVELLYEQLDKFRQAL